MSDSTRDPDSPHPKTGLLDRLKQVLGITPPSLRDDIEVALEQTSDADAFSAHERAILRNVLELHEHRVQDVLIPRADIIAVGIEATLEDVLRVFRTAGHSRLPVHGDTLDDPRGMVHIRDLVDYLAGAVEMRARPRKRRDISQDANIEESTGNPLQGRASRYVTLAAMDLSTPLSQANVVRPVLFVPPSMPVLDLLVKMQTSRTHMGLVIDEYGGTEGLVSIEDVVEMIVGDIEDEHDLDEEPRIESLGNENYLVDARADLTAVSEKIGVDLTQAGESTEVDTLGGLVTGIAGRVPARGEIIRSATLPIEFEVVDADPRRVKRVRIRAADDKAAGVLANSDQSIMPGAIS